MEIRVTQEMLKDILDVYKSNKKTLADMSDFIENNGCLDSGIKNIEESFEMGYNNALEYVFSVLGYKPISQLPLP